MLEQIVRLNTLEEKNNKCDYKDIEATQKEW